MRDPAGWPFGVFKADGMIRQQVHGSEALLVLCGDVEAKEANSRLRTHAAAPPQSNLVLSRAD